MSTDVIDSDFLTISDAVIERGYKNCKTTCKKYFSNTAWMTANLPAQNRKAMAALGWHLIRCVDFLDLESFDGLPLDVWRELISDIDEGFRGLCRTPQSAALADAVQRFSIPKEHVFEIMTAADYWTRNRKFDTYEELEGFTSKFGGSMMAACAPVLGAENDDHFEASLKCGQAIQLTFLLANFVPNLKQHQPFFAAEDIERTKLSITRTMMRQPSDELKNFVRLQTSRIEKLFLAGGQVVPQLDFDGQRTLKSLLDYAWAVFTKMRAHPESILQPGGVLTSREKLQLRTRHLLGTEGKSPVIGESHGHGH